MWFVSSPVCLGVLFFFFNDTATTEIYPLSLHDALPIYRCPSCWEIGIVSEDKQESWCHSRRGPPRKIVCSPLDRKSTRLNSSHGYISYAVFCLKKKTQT